MVWKKSPAVTSAEGLLGLGLIDAVVIHYGYTIERADKYTL